MAAYQLFKTALGCYLYDTGRNEVLIISAELFDYLNGSYSRDTNSRQFDVSSELEELRLCGYLSEHPIETIEHPGSRALEFKINRHIKMMILQVTQRCNLRCSYCIYSSSQECNRNHTNRSMTWATAKKAVDYYAEHSIDVKDPVIAFYGGEPLLEFELIKSIVLYAETVFWGRNLTFRITTNGTLLDEEAVRFLSEPSHHFNILINIDGSRETHDRNRKFSNGAGTYEAIERNIENAVRISNSFLEIAMINTVIDTANGYEAYVRVTDDSILEKMKIQYNYVEENGHLAEYDEEYLMAFNYDLFLGYVEYYRSSSPRYPNKLIEYHINYIADLLRRFKSKKLMPVDAPGGPCDPGVSRLFVDCDGNFYPCERVDERAGCNRIGSLDYGLSVASAIEMLNIGKLTETNCKNCWAFQLCSLCIKRANDGDAASSCKKLSCCPDAIALANDQVNQVILRFENERYAHKRRAGKRPGIVESISGRTACIAPFTIDELPLAMYLQWHGVKVVCATPRGICKEEHGLSFYLNRPGLFNFDLYNSLEDAVLRCDCLLISDGFTDIGGIEDAVLSIAAKRNKVTYHAGKCSSSVDLFQRIEKYQTGEFPQPLSHTPVLTIGGVSPHCESFATTCAAVIALEERGYQPSVLTCNAYGSLMGFHSLADLGELTTIEGVRKLRRAVRCIEFECHPDIIIVDLPEPFLMFNEETPYDYGLSAFALSRAIPSSAFVACLPASMLDHEIVGRVLDGCVTLFGSDIACASFTNCMIETANDYGAQSVYSYRIPYKGVKDGVERLRTIEPCVFAPLLARDELEKMGDWIERELLQMDIGVIS